MLQTLTAYKTHRTPTSADQPHYYPHLPRKLQSHQARRVFQRDLQQSVRSLEVFSVIDSMPQQQGLQPFCRNHDQQTRF